MYNKSTEYCTEKEGVHVSGKLYEFTGKYEKLYG